MFELTLTLNFDSGAYLARIQVLLPVSSQPNILLSINTFKLKLRRGHSKKKQGQFSKMNTSLLCSCDVKKKLLQTDTEERAAECMNDGILYLFPRSVPSVGMSERCLSGPTGL